jgi:protein-S-isoprenylcysteine O-methyltransferase Ste14
VLLDQLGLLPLARGVALVMAISSALITFGLALMAGGWWQTWRAKGELVMEGLYRFVRHPQYAGFLLVIVGFLVQWPTLPTLVLFPVLLIVYVRLARREEAELEERFGERYATYRARTPMLLPGWSTVRRGAATARPGGLRKGRRHDA